MRIGARGSRVQKTFSMMLSLYIQSVSPLTKQVLFVHFTTGISVDGVASFKNPVFYVANGHVGCWKVEQQRTPTGAAERR